ncbi:MAG: hypothetical protein JO281_01920 [Pseudonocardiales bacterium]|nr:hypothetical protein [Pseudonocardiales bacterium]
MLIKLVLAVALVLTASCSATPAPSTSPGPPKPFEPSKWVKSALTIPIPVGPDWQEAGWDGGLLMAAVGFEAPAGSLDEVATSKDGHDWRASTPVRMTLLGCEGRIVAGYGTAAYLVGWTSQGPTVRRTEDGERWETIPLGLGDLKVRSPLDLWVTVAAGPRGVIVVGTDSFTPPHYQGVYVWYSPDGRSFGGPVRVSGPQPVVVAQGTPEGFLLGMSDNAGSMLLSSEDGVH